MNEWTQQQAGPRREAEVTRPTIVVPLDGSEAALAAVPVAKRMAQIGDRVLHLVHIGDKLEPTAQLIERLGLKPDQVRGTVLDEVVGPPAPSIVRIASQWETSLIVMCTHTGLTRERRGLGPVAEQVLAGAPCPLLLVRPERGLTPWELNHVLLPHDGTPTTASALSPAAVLAQRAGAILSVLHVASAGARQPEEPGTMTTPPYVDQPQHEWPAWAAEFQERVRVLGHLPPELRLRLFLSKGKPGAEVVRFARRLRTDLVVLAWHGSLSREHAETVKTVLEDSPCPVLAIPFAPS